jgi:transcriptional regulator with XRE-family HTH domain
VAQVLGVTHQQIQKYESGRNRIPLQVLPRLCDLFGVTAEALLHGIGPALPRSQSLEKDLEIVFYALARVKNRDLRNRIVQAVDVLCGAG